MHTYRPGSFSDVAETDLGRRIWKFLQQHDNLIRMETACQLGLTAVEGLVPGLLRTFGDEVRPDRVKQMIGNMTRQVMEANGYRIDRQNVRIPPSRRLLFTSATRYKQMEAGSGI